MAIGMMLSGIVAGLASVIWALVSGYPILLLLVVYPVAGILGALVFLAIVGLRSSTPQGQSSLHPIRQGR